MLDALSTKKTAARFNWATELGRLQPESPYVMFLLTIGTKMDTPGQMVIFT